MAKQYKNLTHHEALRYDYLHKNIHYLNDKEKRELIYLGLKIEGEVATPQSRPISNKSRSERFASERPVEPKEESIIPSYPRSRRVKKEKRKAIRPLESRQEPASLAEDIPVYPRTRPPKKEKTIRKKRKKGKIKRFFSFLLFLLLATLAGMVFMFFKGYNSIETDPASRSEVFHGEKTRDGVNILVLGTDGRMGDSSDMTRTDSIMVVNINNKDKKIKLVSFMRDTLISIEGNDYKLNSAYTFGEQDNHQGAENVRQVLKENFDIHIQHYVLVDFSTFATAIDTLFPNGVEMDAQFSTIDGQAVNSVEVPDDLNMKDGIVPNQTIQVGKQRMDGRTLLNYARFRKDDEGDFGRTRRQQQVMGAIMTQVKDPTKLFTGSEALGKVFALTSTSVPYSFMLTNGLPLTVNSSNGVEQTTVPEMGDWIDEYDVYGGQGLKVDFDKYKQRLAELGFR